MQTSPQHYKLQPRVFRYSLDWRFLLPVAEPAKIHVLVEEDAELEATLEQVGIPVSNQHSLSELRASPDKQVEYLALPFGLPARWVSANESEQTEFFRSLGRLLRPGSYLLAGFHNAWKPHRPSKYRSLTPRRAARQLEQAGFHAVQLFGALPDLDIPEYIFHLEAQTVRFTLLHRFRRKPAMRNALQMLARTVGWTGLSKFLPCYLVLAVV